MPKPILHEFHEGAILVYRDSDASMAQVAKDFGISASCLKSWLTIDKRSSSRTSGSVSAGSEALREAKTDQVAREGNLGPAPCCCPSPAGAPAGK